MITAGIDCGTKTVKVVIMKSGAVLGRSIIHAGLDTRAAANQAFGEALRVAGMKGEDIGRVLATGAGKTEAEFAHGEITEAGADGKGINHVAPSVRTVIDVGAEHGRAVRIDARGRVVDFAMNEKCAAGAGVFVEAMARALETTVDKMAELYAQSTKEITMNAQCAVFAESELVTLVHSRTAKADIARAVLNAIADRIVSMARRVGIEKDVAVIGGLALNDGFIAAMEKEMSIRLVVPEHPQFVSAMGAAIAAAD